MLQGAMSGTVAAQIIPVDLLSIIQTAKEVQFAQYGRDEGHDLAKYETILGNLREEKPQQRLQEYRLARDVVRAILAADEPVVLQGRDLIYVGSAVRTIPHYATKEVEHMCFALMNEDGLFASMGVSAPRFCFQSEVVYSHMPRPPPEPDDPKKLNWMSYVMNPELRSAVATMIKPFDAEHHE